MGNAMSIKTVLNVVDPCDAIFEETEKGNRSITTQEYKVPTRKTLLRPYIKFGIIAIPKRATPIIINNTTTGAKNLIRHAFSAPLRIGPGLDNGAEK